MNTEQEKIVEENVSFSNDKLYRKPIAENFKNILLNTDLNVFSVTAPWGGGKTYFIENLIKLLGKDVVSIYYNAWESDFYDSPLVPLLLELFNELENIDIKSELEEDIKWSKDFAKKICEKISFQAGLNFEVVNCSANFDPNKKTAESDYINIKNQIKDFKDKLKAIQENINKRIVIFVDELDRCNPLYAIKTLEVIKHFFGIKNVIFVLSVDKAQIENSVRTIYGVNKGEENGYLRKFIDVELLLPEMNPENLIAFYFESTWEKIYKFIEKERYYNFNLHKKKVNYTTELIPDWEQEKKSLIFRIRLLVDDFNFSARDIQKYFLRINLSLDALYENDVLLIEPFLEFNAVCMNYPEFSYNYARDWDVESLPKILKNIKRSHWTRLMDGTAYYGDIVEYVYTKGLPSDKEQIGLYQNAKMLYDFLSKLIKTNSPTDVSCYLGGYVFKIKNIYNYR